MPLLMPLMALTNALSLASENFRAALASSTDSTGGSCIGSSANGAIPRARMSRCAVL